MKPSNDYMRGFIDGVIVCRHSLGLDPLGGGGALTENRDWKDYLEGRMRGFNLAYHVTTTEQGKARGEEGDE